jgi:hypothetical protein
MSGNSPEHSPHQPAASETYRPKPFISQGAVEGLTQGLQISKVPLPVQLGILRNRAMIDADHMTPEAARFLDKEIDGLTHFIVNRPK